MWIEKLEKRKAQPGESDWALTLILSPYDSAHFDEQRRALLLRMAERAMEFCFRGESRKE